MENSAYCFGSFVLDLRQGALLTSGGSELPLRPKSFALLRLFVENAGRLLSQDTIMETLWPNVWVTENSVTQCIHDIRRALGSEAAQMIRTRPRHGYVFTGEVTVIPHAGTRVLEMTRKNYVPDDTFAELAERLADLIVARRQGIV